MAKNLSNRQHIMARYGCIVMIFILACIAIIFKLSITTILEASDWNERAKEEMSKISKIEPTRGNILSSNGNILACNETLYDLRINLRHPKFTKLDTKARASIDSLADSLDTYYPLVKNLDRRPDPNTPESWRYLFNTQFNIPKLKDRKSTATIGRKLRMEDYDVIRKWPFFKDIKSNGMKCPLYAEEHIVRVYPFGDMACLSIGLVNFDSIENRIKGLAGLEWALDSLLYGHPGTQRKVPLTTGLTNWVITPPVRGYDILTTIDIDIQDILEDELIKVCDSVRAEWGTAIVMEVATGEIKAISNVERDTVTGKFKEAMNRAIRGFEPGSVMKPISLMIAFEDGIVKTPNDIVDCSPFQRTSDHAGGGMKSMKQVIETSSNPGIARVIFRKYAKHPEEFKKRLESIGFFERMHSGIGNEKIPKVPDLLPTRNGHPVKMASRHLDLARQAYGYNTEIPPIYTLSYYNAIANKGKYVRPHLVRALRDEEGKDSVLPITYIRDHVCSEQTADYVKQCLHEVVWGKRGTARALQDDRVKICGKTGTAYPFDYEVLKGYDQSKRRYAFAGFFPYDNPKYSCMVLITANAHSTSAARSSGKVLLNVALKLFARGMLHDKSTSYTTQKVMSAPQLFGNNSNDSRIVAKSLGMNNARQVRTRAGAAKGKVPDVTGMDLGSAIKTLESNGISVERINGSGLVVTQSLKAGTPITKGAKCSIWLSWK